MARKPAVRKVPKLPVSGLRSKARVFAPEAFDAGQVVEHAMYRGVVWSLGWKVERGLDSRWVVCEDGVVRLLLLAKVDGELSIKEWDHAQWDYVPAGALPFSVQSWGEEPQPELPAQPSIFELALAA